nr:restriction endonuclease subunit S [Acinetobacter indicus]
MSAPTLRFKEFESKVEVKKLGNISNIVVGFVGTVSDQYCDPNEGIPFVRTQNVREGYFSIENLEYVTKEFHKKNKKSQIFNGDVLIARVGANMGMVCAVENLNTEANCANVIIIKKNSQLNSQYLSLFLNSENGQKQIHSGGAGGAQAVFNTTLAKEISFPYFPLQEQTKIASFLSAVDEKISQLTQKHQLLSQYKQGMMQKLFNQQIRFKADDGSEFGEWGITSIKDAVSFIKDGTHGTHQDDPSSNLFLLSAKNLQNGKIVIDEKDRKINQKEFDSIYKNYNLKDGDILLSVVGTIGRVAIFKDYYESYAFQRSVAFMRFKKALPEFIYQLFLAKDFQNELLVRQVVSAQPGIYLGDLSKIEIKLPCLAEQTKIANFLSAIDQKIEVVAQQIKQAKQWKKGLLQQMFV